MTTGEKFRLFVNQSISPPYILASGISAASTKPGIVLQPTGQGWNAYGDRLR